MRLDGLWASRTTSCTGYRLGVFSLLNCYYREISRLAAIAESDASSLQQLAIEARSGPVAQKANWLKVFACEGPMKLGHIETVPSASGRCIHNLVPIQNIRHRPYIPLPITQNCRSVSDRASKLEKPVKKAYEINVPALKDRVVQTQDELASQQ